MCFLFDKMCENRGYAPDFFEKMSVCDHPLPKNIDVLARKLYDYRIEDKLIVVLTDFDLDGICAGVIAYSGLAELGFRVSLYRLDTRLGYGFDAYTIDDLLREFPDVSGIITGDVGISCLSGIKRAHELGLEIFVTDHHIGSLSTGADVTVDPNTPEDPDSYSYICGSVVMYYLLHYYAEHYVQNPAFALQQIDRLRAFAGFATVSDSMPVYHENREFIRDAMTMCQFIYSGPVESTVALIPGCDTYRRVFFGLYEVLSAFHDMNKFTNVWQIDEDFFGFYLAPMFNSLKRLEQDVGLAYSIFFGGSEVARESVQKLLYLNDIRKELVVKSMGDIHVSEDRGEQPWAPYIYLTDAPGGIRGLLAQQLLAEHDHAHPVLVVAQTNFDEYNGSGRSPVWYPYLDMAGFDPDDRWSAEGHNPAFGVCVRDSDAMDALYQFLRSTVDDLRPDEEELKFVPDFVIDTTGNGDTGIDISAFREFLHQVKLCKPFGNGFPKHQVLLRFRSSEAAWMLLGSEGEHVKMVLPGGLQVLCFRQGEGFHGKIVIDDLPDVVEIVGGLSYNEFNGVTTVQFMGSFVTDLFDTQVSVVDQDKEQGIVMS